MPEQPFKYDLPSFLANLPNHSGVYEMLDKAGHVIYVGKAKNLKNRVKNYFHSQSSDKTISLVKNIRDIRITVTQSETEAVLLECNLIKKHHPRYNVLLRDDKSYPYILITTAHDYPRIDLYRGSRKKKGRYFGPYPSAYAVRETISLIQKIFKIRTCQDSFFSTRIRPCLLYQIDRCTGPCVDLINQAEYAKSIELAIHFLEGKNEVILKKLEARMEAASTALNFELAAQYRDQLMRVRQIQEKQYVTRSHGDADIIGIASQSGTTCLQLMLVRGGKVLGSQPYFPIIPPHANEQEILAAFISQHYFGHPSHTENIPKLIIVGEKMIDQPLLEKALSKETEQSVSILLPQKGEKKKWLSMANANAKQSLTAFLTNRSTIEERMLNLQDALGLIFLPERIECFDISHSMGESTVASCVVFTQTGAQKNEYRRFNIKEISPGDDLAAMRQVLLRRFKKLKQAAIKLPEIILIDGGATQLKVAEIVMNELEIHHVLLLAVSKGPKRKAGFETLHRLNETPIHLPHDSQALHFIQQIRDEAHRFAITGHRKQRDKKRRQSILEEIPGIGAKRRRELLRYFGGIQGIVHASLEELTKVPGINQSLAERLFTTLHETN